MMKDEDKEKLRNWQMWASFKVGVVNSTVNV